MKKETIIFADPDHEYLNFLEGRIIPELEETAEILIINDFSYFQKYMSVFQKQNFSKAEENRQKGQTYEEVCERMVLLFVWKDWGMELWRKIGGKNVFLVGEQAEEGIIPVIARSWDESKIREKINAELARMRREDGNERQRTKTLLVYSAVGGSGVSTVAWESACYLAKEGKRVFFIGADTWQDCRCFMECVMESAAEEFFATSQKSSFSFWKQWIWHGSFDALPPFEKSYACLGLTCEFFRKIEKDVRETNDYDWIVVETDHAYNEWLTEWMANSDKVLIVARQGEKWRKLLPVLKKSIAILPREKFCFVYNFFRSQELEETVAKKLGWDAELFLHGHGGTKAEWEQWRKKLGEILNEE